MSRRSPLLIGLFALLSVASVACSKPEQAGGAAGSPPSATGVATAPSVAASASAPAADKNAPPAASVAAAPAGDGGNAKCGTKPLPDCPLQAWMKSNTNTAMTANDLPALATALDKLVAMAPAGYTNWASISKDGAKAAKAGDTTAAKASCRGCHEQYKQKYKTELREKAL